MLEISSAGPSISTSRIDSRMIVLEMLRRGHPLQAGVLDDQVVHERRES